MAAIGKDTAAKGAGASNILAPEIWDCSRKYAGTVANISSLFSTAIRCLMKDTEQKLKVPSSSSTYCLGRLLASDSFKAPIFYAAKSFKGKELATHKFLTPADLSKLFSPDELAHLVAMVYLYRRIRKGCDEAEWAELSKLIHVNAEISALVGRAIPNIGFSWGLTLGTIHFLSMGLFLRTDAKVFQKYRRMLKSTKVPWNLQEELVNWGCTHVHTGSMLVQSLGLGGAFSKGFTTGYLLNVPEQEMDRDSYRLMICWKWLESLRTRAIAPDIKHRGEFYPLKPELERLIAEIKAIPEDGANSFFAKGKEDLSPEKTPQLFSPNAPAPTTTIEEAPVDAEVLREVAAAAAPDESELA